MSQTAILALSTHTCGQAEKARPELTLQHFLPAGSCSRLTSPVTKCQKIFGGFETDIATLGYTWPMVQKLLMMGRQTKSVQLWNDEEKAPTDRENQIKTPFPGELHDSIDKVREYQRNW